MKSTSVKSPDERGRRYAQRLESVRNAAAAVFAEKGFHGTSIQAIADRLGMRQASLYYYFPSKEAALDAVCRYGQAEGVARMTELAAASLPLGEKLERIVHSQIYGLKTRCDHLLVFIHQRQFLPADSRAQIRVEGRRYRELLEGVLRQAQDAGEVARDVDVALAARMLINLCNAVPGWYREDAEKLDIDQVAAQIARTFLSGIQTRDRTP